MVMNMAKNNLIMSEFYCCLCGAHGIPVWRKRGAEREAGHLKKLYCLKCGKETNHCEIKPFTKYELSDFQNEFEYGNFDEEGNRIKPYNVLKELIKNGTVEKVKTLDSCGNSR